MTDERLQDERNERLRRIADAMLKTGENHGLHTSDTRLIALVNRREQAMIGLHGYDSSADALTDLVEHLRGLCEANGIKLMIAPIGGDQ